MSCRTWVELPPALIHTLVQLWLNFEQGTVWVYWISWDRRRTCLTSSSHAAAASQLQVRSDKKLHHLLIDEWLMFSFQPNCRTEKPPCCLFLLRINHNRYFTVHRGRFPLIYPGENQNHTTDRPTDLANLSTVYRTRQFHLPCLVMVWSFRFFRERTYFLQWNLQEFAFILIQGGIYISKQLYVSQC